jgi:hypothetical protein
MDHPTIIAELQRVAALLDTRTLSRSRFAEHGTVSTGAVEAAFGSWNEAIIAAGLTPLPSGGIPKAEERRLERLAAAPFGAAPARISDDELLADLLRVAALLGRRPSGNQIAAKGKYSHDLYQRRWGSMAKAYEAALVRRQER